VEPGEDCQKFSGGSLHRSPCAAAAAPGCKILFMTEAILKFRLLISGKGFSGGSGRAGVLGPAVRP